MQSHPVVMDLLPPEYIKMGVVPVGRLDKDTEGLLYLPMMVFGDTLLSMVIKHVERFIT